MDQEYTPADDPGSFLGESWEEEALGVEAFQETTGNHDDHACNNNYRIGSRHRTPPPGDATPSPPRRTSPSPTPTASPDRLASSPTCSIDTSTPPRTAVAERHPPGAPPPPPVVFILLRDPHCHSPTPLGEGHALSSLPCPVHATAPSPPCSSQPRPASSRSRHRAPTAVTPRWPHPACAPGPRLPPTNLTGPAPLVLTPTCSLVPCSSTPAPRLATSEPRCSSACCMPPTRRHARQLPRAPHSRTSRTPLLAAPWPAPTHRPGPCTLLSTLLEPRLVVASLQPLLLAPPPPTTAP
nr:vegetative cell wall protein gp1-like [Aegilops tauschii subsp. strangulata]